MARHLNNAKSVQQQIEELQTLQARVKLLSDEMKTYMDTNGIDTLEGETLSYTRSWTEDYYKFNTKQFEQDNPTLFGQYRNQLVAGSYRYSVKAVKP